MPRDSKRHPYDFGYLLTFLLLLVLAGAAVLLLLPSYRDYRAKKQQSVKLEKELEEVKSERDDRLKEVNELKSSPAAVEKVARERYKQVRPGETVLTYTPPGSTK